SGTRPDVKQPVSLTVARANGGTALAVPRRAAGGLRATVGGGHGAPPAPWVESSRALQARCEGFDLHGAVAVAGEDRDRLEQLCRCLLRPPIAHERLALRPDGR